MDPALWDELAVLFDRVLEMPSEERSAFLEEIKQKNKSLWNELVSLLLFAENASSYFEDVQNLTPGEPSRARNHDVLEDPYRILGQYIGRYHIQGVIGAGGMGMVYRAMDTQLGRTVALKFLPPMLNHNEEARQRFYVEARAASSLDHPNVCTIYEIGSTPDGHIFIAMGYYEGESLSQKLDREDLPVGTVIDYVTQIAHGLAAAHDRTIIHRDIKPGNILVTPQGVVKILDFGLAKMADQHLTRTGMTMGTVAYMSPELIRGGAPNPGTDIWSLGVIMYESLTGLRPFRGAIPEAVMYSVINNEPDYEQELGDLEPAGIKDILARCLHKNPAKRYPSVAPLLDDLTALLPDRVSPPSTAARRSFLRRKQTLISAGIASALLILLSIFIPLNDSSSETTDTRIAFLPFNTASDQDEEDQVLAEGLMHLMAGMLLRMDSPDHPVSVVPISEIQQLAVDTPEDAYRQLGANVVIQGELSRLRDVIALSFKLTNPGNNSLIGDHMSLLDGQQDTDPLTDSFQEKLFDHLADLLDIPVTEAARAAYNATQTRDPDALTYYLQGIGYLNRIYQDNFYDYAIQQFQQSLEQDSLFAPAHAGLCEALFEKFNYTLEQEYVEQARPSCDRAAELGSNQVPVLITLGQIYLKTGNKSASRAVLDRALALEPENAEIYHWIGRIFERDNALDSAITYYQQAITLKPNNWLYYIGLGYVYSAQGNIAASAEQFEIVRKLTPDNYLAVLNLGVARFSLGDLEQAKESFQEALYIKPGNIFAHRLAGIVLVVEGDNAAAIDTLRPAAAANDLMALDFTGRAYQASGNQALADTAWSRLDRAASIRLSVDSTDAISTLLKATALASLGDTGAAVDLLETIPEAHKENYVGYLTGRIYESNHERGRALSYIERAFQDYFNVLIMESDPMIDSLRSSPEYQALLAQFYATR